MTPEINNHILLQIITDLLEKTDFFCVGIDVQGKDCFTIKIDHAQRSIMIDDCIDLSRKVQEQLFTINSDLDIELTVSSSGIGQPLTDIRQFIKLQGKNIEILFQKGRKLVALLETVDPQGVITFSYDIKQKIEGKKRPMVIKQTETLLFAEAVWIKEHI